MLYVFWASLVAHVIKNLPAMQETEVRFLGRENSLGKGLATYSGILAWRIPWTDCGARVHGVTKSDKTEPLMLLLQVL